MPISLVLSALISPFPIAPPADLHDTLEAVRAAHAAPALGAAIKHLDITLSR